MTVGRDVRWSLALAVVAGAVGTACIVATYPRLSHTWDEATHVAAGLEVVENHRYTYQTENPPLSRLTIAVGPWIAGTQMPQGYNAFDAADTIFHSAPDYVQRVTVARIGTLP